MPVLVRFVFFVLIFRFLLLFHVWTIFSFMTEFTFTSIYSQNFFFSVCSLLELIVFESTFCFQSKIKTKCRYWPWSLSEIHGVLQDCVRPLPIQSEWNGWWCPSLMCSFNSGNTEQKLLLIFLIFFTSPPPNKNKQTKNKSKLPIKIIWLFVF